MSDYLKEKFENFKLFKTLNNTDLSKIYNVSRSRIGQVRKLFASEISTLDLSIKKKKEQRIEQNYNKLVAYIKQNSNNICLRKAQKELRIYPLRKKHFIEIANELKYKITFIYSSSEHGVNSYLRKKCRCKICKFSITLRTHFRRNGFKVDCKTVNIYANTLLDDYLNDKSKNKKLFYFKIEELEKIKLPETHPLKIFTF